MGILDFLFTESWEEYQRVKLMKKLGNAAENLTEEELEKAKKIIENEE